MLATRDLRLEVGGIVLSARGEGLPGRLGAEPHFRPFLSGNEPDLALVFRRGRVREDRAVPVFDSGGVWRLLRYPDGQWRYDLADPLFGPEPYAQALLDPELETGEVRLRTLRGHRRHDVLYPFVYPLDEILTISLLSRLGGLHVHAAGIDDGGRGLLFPGISGAGKSTMSRLWRGAGPSTPPGRVLSDDRTIIRLRDDRPVIHGTPWHGEAELCFPGNAPLSGVFFLEQSRENRAIPMKPSEAAAELVARSFPAYWDADGLATALRSAARVTAAAPAFRLRFRRDAGAVTAAREALA